MKKFIPLLCLLFVISCDFTKRLDNKAMIKEMKEKQVKRVLPQDITNTADALGRVIESEILKGKSLDSLANKYMVSIQHGAVNQLTSKDEKIKGILEAIAYSVSQNQEIPSNIQKNSSGDSLMYIFQQKNEIYLIGFGKSTIVLNMDKPLIK